MLTGMLRACMWVGVVVMGGLGCQGRDPGCQQRPPSALLRGVQTLTTRGGRVDWLKVPPHTVAFDREVDGCFQTWLTQADGSGEHCLSCGMPGLPSLNVGQPAWHPSGRFLVVQAEKDGGGRTCTQGTNPGAGTRNELWVVRMDTREAQRLRGLEAGHLGMLHPHFSDDGNRLSWSEMTGPVNPLVPGHALGRWRLMTGDVVEVGGWLQLQNLTGMQPAGNAFYENHGFSPDGSRLLFTSNLTPGAPWFRQDIHTVDSHTGADLKTLTDRGYNEHASYSPDGQSILWMSSRCVAGSGTDYWLMEADGSNHRRVTFFNDRDSEHHRNQAVVAADASWSADGRQVAAYLQIGGPDQVRHGDEEIVVLDLDR